MFTLTLSCQCSCFQSYRGPGQAGQPEATLPGVQQDHQDPEPGGPHPAPDARARRQQDQASGLSEQVSD